MKGKSDVGSRYADVIREVFSRHRSVQTAGFTADAYKPGLERMKEFDRLLGNPSSRLRCIHVAGTNGKGSVCHMLASVLAGEGLEVGLYTSPHLLDFRERVRIVTDGEISYIPKEEVLEFLNRFRSDIDRLDLSFFEITTGMAFWWFDKRGTGIVVVETGLGGRLDSTNVITPELSVISSIGLDHCALLGDTRAAIASEKAGIFKPGVPAVVSSRDNETEPVFRDAAEALGCPLHFADEIPCPDLSGWGMDLPGEYQSINVRTVLCALDVLGHRPLRHCIAHTAVRTGLRGRWDTLSERPLIIADIGHNPAALECNFAQLAEMFSDKSIHDRLIVVYGVMADKDLDGILRLMPKGNHVSYIFTAPRTERALPAEAILERFRTMNDSEARVCNGVAAAVGEARSIATEKSVIYVGGSAFVVAEALGSISV